MDIPTPISGVLFERFHACGFVNAPLVSTFAANTAISLPIELKSTTLLSRVKSTPVGSHPPGAHTPASNDTEPRSVSSPVDPIANDSADSDPEGTTRVRPFGLTPRFPFMPSGGTYTANRVNEQSAFTCQAPIF